MQYLKRFTKSAEQGQLTRNRSNDTCMCHIVFDGFELWGDVLFEDMAGVSRMDPTKLDFLYRFADTETCFQQFLDVTINYLKSSL